MSYFLKPNNQSVEPYKITNNDFHELLDLTGFDHLCKNIISVDEARSMSNSLIWIERFRKFCAESQGFEIQ